VFWHLTPGISGAASDIDGTIRNLLRGLLRNSHSIFGGKNSFSRAPPRSCWLFANDELLLLYSSCSSLAFASHTAGAGVYSNCNLLNGIDNSNDVCVVTNDIDTDPRDQTLKRALKAPMPRRSSRPAVSLELYLQTRVLALGFILIFACKASRTTLKKTENKPFKINKGISCFHFQWCVHST
jgi:hypothetical protein